MINQRGLRCLFHQILTMRITLSVAEGVASAADKNITAFDQRLW
jgi:hypothetical protein